jgi:hypothetical protein
MALVTDKPTGRVFLDTAQGALFSILLWYWSIIHRCTWPKYSCSVDVELVVAAGRSFSFASVASRTDNCELIYRGNSSLKVE